MNLADQRILVGGDHSGSHQIPLLRIDECLDAAPVDRISDDCQIESFSLEPRKGGRWTYDTRSTAMNINGVGKFHCDGEVLEYDPPRVLSYTWIANWHDRPAQRTVVRWELAGSKGGTLVRVTHSGLVDLPVARKDYSGGWPGVLQDLKKFVEK